MQQHAEDVLAELDGEEEDSKVLHHLKQINTHLASLALTAMSYPSPMPQPNRYMPLSPYIAYTYIFKCPLYRSHSLWPKQPSAVVEYPDQTSRAQMMAAVRPRQTLQHSLSLPAQSNAHRHLPPALPRPPHRSSSFNDKMRMQPVRAASSMTTLSTHQMTDYPGHHPQPSPLVQRPIRHFSSVQSLPVNSYKPPLFSRPTSRTQSTNSLTYDHHLVSEVL